MEPFKLTLSPVNASERDTFDSFDNVVNYETNFGPSDQSLPLSAYNISTEEFTWTDYTYPTSTTTQTTQGGVPVRPHTAPQYQPVWCDLPHEGSPPDRSFLVHHDDSLGENKQRANNPRTAAVSKAHLQVLAQISANTSAASKSHKKNPRFVARTLTTPSTRIPAPGTMTSQQKSAGDLEPVSGSTEEEGGDDSSFETVAEALRLQWSVIGSKHLAPANADVVAQVVAQAAGKLKKEGSSPTPYAIPSPRMASTPTLTQNDTPTAEPLNPNMMRMIQSEVSTDKAGTRPTPSWTTQQPSAHTASDYTTVNPIVYDSGPSVRQLNTVSNQNNIGSNINSNFTQFANLPQASGLAGQSRGVDFTSSVPSIDNSDTVREGSYSSEVEIARYIDQPLVVAGLSTNYQLESEEFLKSLPPIKPINLEAYAAAPLLPPVTRKHPQRRHHQTVVAGSNKLVPSGVLPQTESSSTRQSSASEVSTLPSVLKSGGDYEAAKTETGDSTKSSQAGATPNNMKKSVSFSLNNEPGSESIDRLADEETSSLVNNSSSAASRSGVAVATEAAYRKQVEEIVKEKAKLQGQVEVLALESQTVLQERAELQAQLTHLKSRLSQAEEVNSGQGSSDSTGLRREVSNLRESRGLLEQTVLAANRALAEKVEEIRGVQAELQLAQDAANKLQVKTQEMRDEIRSRDMNVQALKNKIAELYVEVQTSIQAKMEADTEARTARTDLASLVKAKEWYQGQLQAAHDVRSKLQREITLLQGQAISHGAIVERLKTESARLRQQLSESQQRSLKDKEALAKHLEVIQGDMMEREAAFLEIQRERKLYEDTFNSQVSTVEEEKSRLEGLQQATSDLEAQLSRAQTEATKRHEQLVQMETGQMDVMKRLAVAEKRLGEKEKALEDMEEKLIQVEAHLDVVMSDLIKKENEILSLKEEKASTEIALKSALLEKSSVDKALDSLKADMGKVELSFKQMKQELGVRTAELEGARLEREKLQESLDSSQHELEIKTLSINSMTRTFDDQSSAHQDLATERDALQQEVDELRVKVQNLEFDLGKKDEELSTRAADIDLQSTKVAQLEAKVLAAQDSLPAEKVQIYEAEIATLREKVQALEETEQEECDQLEGERAQQRAEIERLRAELADRQMVYDSNVAAMDGKMKELLTERQQLETELGIATRSEELAQMEERDAYTEEIQSLSRELSSARQDKQELEDHLSAMQAEKAAEISTLTSQLEEQTRVLEEMQSQHALLTQTQVTNQSLELELEKERGRVMGLTHTTTELKEHSHQLETALAQRDSALSELRASVEQSRLDLDTREQAFLQRIYDLEGAVAKEVEVQAELRKQMSAKILESKHLQKQCDSSSSELEQLRQDLEASEKTATRALADLDTARQAQLDSSTQREEESRTIKELQVQLDNVTSRLEETLAREPVLAEQIQSLEWQQEQATSQLEAARDKLKQVELRAQEESSAVHASLQDKQSENDNLQSELAALRQEKMQQRSQVNELRGTLQASVQHHKLTRRLNSGELTDVGVQVDRKVVIPPLPFDLAAVEQLIKNTRVRPLESRPVDQLSNCLSSLRAEITGLQKQMDQHTTAVNNSTQSWKTVQSGVNDLNEVMKTIANTIIAANSTHTLTMAAAVLDREQMDIFNV